MLTVILYLAKHLCPHSSYLLVSINLPAFISIVFCFQRSTSFG
uniref:Uncharacterized protein n=1 Tax=Rhizophora mucronata TaxID=61149 RepID=A0A2P2ISQ6_RHIMU